MSCTLFLCPTKALTTLINIEQRKHLAKNGSTNYKSSAWLASYRFCVPDDILGL